MCTAISIQLPLSFVSCLPQSVITPFLRGLFPTPLVARVRTHCAFAHISLIFSPILPNSSSLSTLNTLMGRVPLRYIVLLEILGAAFTHSGFVGQRAPVASRAGGTGVPSQCQQVK